MARFVLALLLAVPFAVRSADDEPIAEGLQGEELERARAAVAAVSAQVAESNVLHADYVQTLESLLLVEPLVSSGRLHLRSEPGCLVLECEDPRRVEIRSDATSHQVYTPGTNRAERYVFASNELAKVLLACLSADLSDLEEAFVITGFAESGKDDELEYSLAFVPRAKRLRALLSSVTLVVRARDAAVVSLQYDNPEAESVLLTFRELVRDPREDPEAGVFDRELPEGVQLLVRRVDRDD